MITELLHSAQYCYKHKFNRLGIFFEKLMMLLCSSHISGRAKIAKKVSFSHGGIGVIVNSAASIDEGTIVGPHVVIGNRFPHKGCPQIGKNVYIGVGAKILGGVKIGDNAKIGANAVVLSDVPTGCIAVGVPARILNPHNAVGGG